jgi:hypothetical protein
MENINDFDKILIEKMSVDELEIEVPGRFILSEARKKVQSRKKTKAEREDLFWLVARFLNVKIKLYHAVLACVIIGGSTLYFTNERKENKSKGEYQLEESNMVSINSSTVLSCIKTFIYKK